MEPGHEDREYVALGQGEETWYYASMEPGHEDREYRPHRAGPYRRATGLNGARS